MTYNFLMVVYVRHEQVIIAGNICPAFFPLRGIIAVF